MNLYLVQHGEAEKEEVDSARPLTGKGRNDVRKVAMFTAGAGVRVDRVFHSGKLRARETADILAELLRPAAGSGETDGLAALDDPVRWVERLRGMTENTMLVGHLPHLQRLTGLLLCGAAERKSVAFTMGGIVAVVRDDAGNWSLCWMVIPDLIRE